MTYPPPPKRNFRGHGSSSQAGPSRAGTSQVRAAAYVDLDAPAAATVPPPQVVPRGSPPAAAAAVVTPLEPPAFAEPFPAANVRADFCRGRSLPEQCTRGLLTMFPPVGADIWDASPVVAVIALAEVLARVSRRISTLAVDVQQAGQPALAQRLYNDFSGRALGNQLRVQLSTTLSQLPTYGSGSGSTPHSVSNPPPIVRRQRPKWWSRPAVQAAVAQRSQLWAGADASAAELWARRGVRPLCRRPCEWELCPAGAVLPQRAAVPPREPLFLGWTR